MAEPYPTLHERLIGTDDSVPVVVDMQSRFYDKYDSAFSGDVIARAAQPSRAKTRS